MNTEFEFFTVAPPGAETVLHQEMHKAGFAHLRRAIGGVYATGGLDDVARANLTLRRAVRVLMRVAEFRAMHLAQLDKRAKRVDWAGLLRPGTSIAVDATCHKSRIYHHKAAAQRIARALHDAGFAQSDTPDITIKARIHDDLCTISIDTTGDALHQRGHKMAIGKAPLRENLAAAFLGHMGFDGTQMVVDPMCGSGTIVLEAADIAAGLLPGRSRRFAFAHLAGMAPIPPHIPPDLNPELRFYGYDRDQGAIQGAAENAKRAGVEQWCRFTRQALSDLTPPPGAPGFVLTNPPYGARIGDRKLLFGLYGALGAVLAQRFHNWQIGIITSDPGLAKATGLDLQGFGPIAHGGLKITLWHGRI